MNKKRATIKWTLDGYREEPGRRGKRGHCLVLVLTELVGLDVKLYSCSAGRLRAAQYEVLQESRQILTCRLQYVNL